MVVYTAAFGVFYGIVKVSFSLVEFFILITDLGGAVVKRLA